METKELFVNILSENLAEAERKLSKQEFLEMMEKLKQDREGQKRQGHAPGASLPWTVAGPAF